MIICLCGNTKEKKIIIKKLMNQYGDKLVICNYYKEVFNTIIDTENIKYKLIDECDSLQQAHQLYNNHVNKIVTTNISNFLENNKEKIILLISDNILSKDINETIFFDQSDLKILIAQNNEYSLFNHEVRYQKSLFDCIIDTKENIDIKKLVKL